MDVGSLSNERGFQFADFLFVPTSWFDRTFLPVSHGKRHH
jgi:hypothetical protein